MNRFLQRYEKLAGCPIERIDLPQVIRINTLKVEEKAIIKRLAAKEVKLKKIDYLRHGYEVVSSPFSVGATNEYLQGYYYLQGAASQIPVQVLGPKPGEHVLDMCAAPGSKTSQIAQYMNNKGVLVATDVNASRVQTLRNNLMRMGVENSVLFPKDGRFISDLGYTFDRILLDAPCSGNFISEEDWFEKRDKAGILKCASVQRQLISAAIAVLKEGGTMVYSTCSLEPEENEAVIQWAVDEFNMEIIPAEAPFVAPGLSTDGTIQYTPEMKRTLRLWPHILATEGFFIAKLRKRP